MAENLKTVIDSIAYHFRTGELYKLVENLRRECDRFDDIPSFDDWGAENLADIIIKATSILSTLDPEEINKKPSGLNVDITLGDKESSLRRMEKETTLDVETELLLNAQKKAVDEEQTKVKSLKAEMARLKAQISEKEKEITDQKLMVQRVKILANSLIKASDQVDRSLQDDLLPKEKVMVKILEGLEATLESVGVITIKDINVPFDEKKHHLVDIIPTQDENQHMIISTSVLTGYGYENEIIRPQQVIVYKLL